MPAVCQSIFISSCCLSFICAVVWLGVGLGVVRPAWYISQFQPALCRTERYYWAGDRVCDCGSQTYETQDAQGNTHSREEQCWSRFPCVQVYVTVRTEGARVLRNRFLHWSEIDLFTQYYKQCGTSSCSRYAWTNEAHVQNFRLGYGHINDSYECLYNPQEPSEVIAVRHFHKSAVFHGLFWPGLFFAIFLVAAIVSGVVFKWCS